VYALEWTFASHLGPESTAGGVLLWCLEVVAALMSCAYLRELCDALGTARWHRRRAPLDPRRRVPTAALRAVGPEPVNVPPLVSAHVPAHNEPPGMVIDTLRAGWSGMHVDESGGRGIMPLTFEALKGQRYRWCFGGIQLLRMHWKSLLPGQETRKNHLSAGQRWSYLSGALQWYGDLLGLLFFIFLLAGAANLAVHLARRRPRLGARPVREEGRLPAHPEDQRADQLVARAAPTGRRPSSRSSARPVRRRAHQDKHPERPAAGRPAVAWPALSGPPPVTCRDLWLCPAPSVQGILSARQPEVRRCLPVRMLTNCWA
jgi:hypothetical protein